MKATGWLLAAAVVMAGCGADAPAGANAGGAAASMPAAKAEAEAAVTPTGTVIEVAMVTDGAGNYFEPSEIRARRGDVLRFKLVSGVHNVSFPADQASVKTRLPEVGPYLQLPGQTYDVVVSMEPGTYGFQCDPHAALGMVGTLEVVE